MATDSVCVIGPEFISPNSCVLKIETYAVGKLVITDINNKVILKVVPGDSTLHRQRWILDANDIPLLKLREKNTTAHHRWNVYRGESNADSDIIFTTRDNHMIQFGTCVNAYFGNKYSCNDDHHDFQIKGNWSKKNCSIHTGDYSETAIAQMNKVQSLEYLAVKKNYTVTINPNVDCAFVVAIIAIVDAMNTTDIKQAKEVGGVLGVVGTVVTLGHMVENVCGVVGSIAAII